MTLATGPARLMGSYRTSPAAAPRRNGRRERAVRLVVVVVIRIRLYDHGGWYGRASAGRRRAAPGAALRTDEGRCQ